MSDLMNEMKKHIDNVDKVIENKNKPTIYVKSVNAQGVPSMRVLDFTERNADSSNSHENAPKTHKSRSL